MEEWRVESHQTIDHFFRQKCRKLDEQVAEKINKQREEISQIQSKTAELIREQHATRHDLDLLATKIRSLEREINKIERTSLNIKTQPLAVRGTWITIEESVKHQIDVSNLPPICKSIEVYDKSSLVVASNDRFLLMHQASNLCLVDRNLTIVKQCLWDFSKIFDMCWSGVLDRFIVINEHTVFLVDPSKLSIDKISTAEEQEWYSCTCLDRSLLLSTYEYGSSIVEYSLLPVMQSIRHWKPPISCEKDEAINHIRSNNITLALLISQENTKLVHIELRTPETLERLWFLRLDTMNVNQKMFSCCLVNDDEWLVCDHENRRLIHVTGDGKMKTMCNYNSVPYCPCMFGSDTLVVNTRESINFHKF